MRLNAVAPRGIPAVVTIVRSVRCGPMDFRRTTVADLARQVSDRSLSAREATAAALDRIDRHDGELGAFVAVDAEAALAEARAVDERVAAGEDVGPLAGVPIGVKDLEDATGFVTTQGSAAFAGGPPAPADSPLVARLRAAGCVVVGKTNTPELGWKADTVNPTVRRHPQPVGTRPLGRRLVGRVGGGGGRRPGAAGHRVRRRRVDPHPVRRSAASPASSRRSAGSRAAAAAARLGRPVDQGTDDPRRPRPGPRARRGGRPRPDRSAARCRCPSRPGRASLDDLHPPRRVAWSPTLGYATVDPEVLAVCEAAVGRLEAAGTEVVVVDDVFAADPVDEWLTLVGVYYLRVLEPFRDDPTVWDRRRPGAGGTRRVGRGRGHGRRRRSRPRTPATG